MDISISDILKDWQGVENGVNAGDNLRLTVEAERELGMRSTYYLAKYILGYKKLNNTFHVALCRRYDKYKYHCMLDLHPRKHYKTTLNTITGSINLIINDPNITICIIANTMDNSSTFLWEIKNHFIQNDKFRMLYPAHAVETKREEGTSEKFITPARTNISERMATVEAASADRAIVSRHFKVLKFDDFVDDKNAATPALREKTYENYSISLATTSLTPEGLPWHHIVGTRWDWDDAYEHILDDNKITNKFSVLITAAYWKERTKDGTLERNYLFPEQFPPGALEDLRRTMGDYKFSCTPGFATVWMADGTFKPIDQIKVGDEVVGFKRDSEKKMTRTKIVKTKVLKVQNRIAPIVQRVRLENGDEVFCTPEHKWYTGRNRLHKLYRPVSVGSRMVNVVQPIEPDTDIEKIRDWAWFGGILDGEGGLTHGLITITQSEYYNMPVIEKLKRVLRRLNLEFNVFHKKAVQGHKAATMFYLLAWRQEKVRILVNSRFAKHYQLEKQLFVRGGRVGDCGRYKDPKDPDKPLGMRPAVVSIELYKENIPVYALVTDTGNYVSQGYASSNCLYLNQPTIPGEATMDPRFLKFFDPAIKPVAPRRRIITVDPSTSVETRKGDPSVISVFDMDHDSNIYLIDINRGWYDPDEIINRIFDFSRAYSVREIGIESVAFSKYLCFFFEKEMRRCHYHVRVMPIKRPTNVKKNDRLERIQPFLKAGKIYLRQNEPELENIVQEFKRYGFGGYDDFLDTLADGIELLKPPPRLYNEEPICHEQPVVVEGVNFQTAYTYGAGGS